MLNAYDAASLSPPLSAPPGRKSAAGRSNGPEQPFAGLLDADRPADGGAASAMGADRRTDSAEIARLRREREAYQSQRDTEVRRRPQEPYAAIQIALPVNEAGYQPFVTADQQKMIDSITDRYIGKPNREFEKMWAELRANGLAPEQLVQTARHFINDAGDIVDRATATAGRSAEAAGRANTVWAASEVA